MSIRWREVGVPLERGLRWMLGLFLLVAGAAKLPDVRGFFEAMVRLQVPLPEPALTFAAVALPWLEVIVGLALFAGCWRMEALLLALLLCVTFVGVSWHAWARELEVVCSCFGSSSHEPTDFAAATARNLLLASAAGLLLCAHDRDRHRSSDRRI